ncbi:MAG TPA: M56 family metallopeptidase [Verrucomicrobiae bacterium]|nr:M56 family metallopeptidase [Verrucomicrobiae bacterium]
MMNPVSQFARMLVASGQAAVIVLLVLLAQWAFQRHLAARWRHALWWLVVARLLLPFTPASPLSVFNWVNLPRSQDKVSFANNPASAAGPLGKPVATNSVPAPLPQSPVFVSLKASRDVRESQLANHPFATQIGVDIPASLNKSAPAKTRWPVTLFWLWLIGAAGLGILILRQQWKVFRRLRGGEPVRDAIVLALLAECRAALGVARSVELVETDAVASPALCGIWRPRILLPAGMTGALDAKETRHVLLHELAHLKRRDIAVNWLLAALQVTHWFNPVLWFAFRRMRADAELACDELVLEATKGEARAYGETVLKLMAADPEPETAPGMAGILENRQEMKRRIRMIAGFGRVARWLLVAAVTASTLAVIGLTDAARSETPLPLAKKSSFPRAGESELLFQVLDAETSQPVPGAELIVTRCNQVECGFLGKWVAPESGPASIRYAKVDLVRFTVLASAEGYVAKAAEWRPSENDPVPGYHAIKLARGTAVGGFVKDEQGKGIAGATVRLRMFVTPDDFNQRERLATAGRAKAAVTDASGHWVCNNAPSDTGLFEIMVQHPQFLEKTFATDCSDDHFAETSGLIACADLSAQTAVLVLKRGWEVGGRVVDLAGKPVAGARVFLGSNESQPKLTQYSDDDGRFLFQNAMPRLDTVTVQARGFAPGLQTVKYAAARPELLFRLGPPGVIKGRILDSQGQPLEQAIVTARNTYWKGDVTLEWETITDAEGRFAWTSAPTNEVNLVVCKSGFINTNVYLKPNGPEQEVRLTEDLTARKRAQLGFHGQVVDAVTKEPIDEFRVTLATGYWMGTNSQTRTMERHWDLNSIRGSDGGYSVSWGVGEGWGGFRFIKIDAKGYLSAISGPLEKDIARAVNFELKPGHGPRGIVTLPDGQPAAGVEIGLVSEVNHLELHQGRFSRFGEYRPQFTRTDASSLLNKSRFLGG